MENLGPTSNPCNSGKLDHLNNSEMKYLLKYLAKGPGQPAADLPAEENIPSRLDYGPLSEYERIRDCIVEERDQLFLETFGFPLNQRHAVIGQLLGQEEGDSDDNEEEQVTKINESGCQLQNDMCHSSGVKQLVKPRD